MATTTSNTCVFDGADFLRQRLVLSLLSGKSVKIFNIRPKLENPGLKEYEASLIRIFDKITNGTVIEINESGTRLYFQPGLLLGGPIEHECNMERSIGYYLEALMYISPFAKNPVKATLRGITNDNIDPSIDTIKSSMLPVLGRFLGADEGLDLKIIKRGVAALGGGEVVFNCPIKTKLRPLQLLNVGKIKRFRGCAYAVRVSPSMANRIVDAAKTILLKLVPDVYIHTDHRKGEEAGKSPGYGLHLLAETTEGCFYSAEYFSEAKSKDQEPIIPEDIGVKATHLLLQEIYNGGCVDSFSQGLTALLMTLGDKDVSKVQVGPLTSHTIEMLRHIKMFFHVVFKLDWQSSINSSNAGGDDEELKTGGDKVIMTCVGVGYSNINKKII